jgi:hypothetical protein
MAYDIGDLVRLSASFTNSVGSAVDPTTVAVKYKAPGAATVTKTYALAEVTKDSTGHYHYDVSVTVEGHWYYRWESTGTGQAAAEDVFYVNPTRV